jgi:hypothetical protein
LAFESSATGSGVKRRSVPLVLCRRRACCCVELRSE